MLSDILIKLFVTPENIIGLIWDIIPIVGMCFIFHAWKEKWWKSLVPFYSTFLIYKHTWTRFELMFGLQMLFELMNMISAKLFKKHITNNLLDCVKNFFETQTFDLDISLTYLLVCGSLMLVSMIAVFVMTRITYWKICSSLEISNVFLKIGTFLLPQIFLIVDYIYVCRRNAKIKAQKSISGGAGEAAEMLTEKTETQYEQQ